MLHNNMLSDNMHDGLMFHTCFNAPLEWVTAHDSGVLINNILKKDMKEDLSEVFWKKCFNISGGVVNCRTGYDIINDGGNKFKREALLRQLRNGLAHFNLKTYAPEGTINTIKIWVGRRTKKDNRYQEFNDEEITKAICVFTFSVDQLRIFSEYVTDIVLENIDYGICGNCPYQEENENGNPDL